MSTNQILAALLNMMLTFYGKRKQEFETDLLKRIENGDEVNPEEIELLMLWAVRNVYQEAKNDAIEEMEQNAKM